MDRTMSSSEDRSLVRFDLRSPVSGCPVSRRDCNSNDPDRMRRARLRTRRRFAFGEPAVAHVAFPHDAESLRKFRHVVRTFQNTIAAADALVVEVKNDAGDGIFFVGEDRAAIETGGIGAVMARRRDGLRERMRAAAG